MKLNSTSSRGFTLAEVLIASALTATIMSAVLSSFIFMGRNLARLASYQALESEARRSLAYLRRDFALAQSVKSGTNPTASSVTLVLPDGEVTYAYETVSRSLRRQADFGPNRDLLLLRSSTCECTTFAFRYFTTRDEAPTDQLAPDTNVPYSIKQIQARFVIESPAAWSAETRTRFEAASARFLFRNRGAPDGT